MTGKQLMNLLNQLTEEELERRVILDLRFVFAGDLDAVQIDAKSPHFGEVIRLRELRSPYLNTVLRPDGGEE